MPRPAVLAPVLVGLALVGCASQHHRLPRACTQGVDAIERALQAAPRQVVLGDGTRLSRCISEARSDAELQTMGAIYTSTADRLARSAPADDAAAIRLGYLIGATRRGATHTAGIHLELVRRLEQAAGFDGLPPARRAALGMGIAAGRRSG